MNKALIGIALVVVLGGGAWLWMQQVPPVEMETKATFDPKNATYTIFDKPYTLVNGSVEVQDTEFSRETVTYFGNEARGDLNGDGVEDAAFIVVWNGGGTGQFVNVVAYVSEGATYRGTNGVILGDRIAPQSTEIRDGQIIVNYADRRPEEAMAEEPSIGVSRYLVVKDGMLVDAPVDYTWMFEPAGEKAGGIPLTKVTLTARGNPRLVGTYEGICFDMKGSAWKMDDNEAAGAVCWWAGGGNEIGVFNEEGKIRVKEGLVSEGDAESAGYRGDFETLFEM